MNLTVTTVNAELARILEPRAPRSDLRLDAIRKLRAAGVNAGVICAPVIPGITDAPPDLEALVRAAAQAGADYIYANPLFLKPCSAAVFLPFLEQQFPHLVKSYRERFNSRAFLPRAYHTGISQLMARLRKKYEIGDRLGRDSRRSQPAPRVEEQLTLF